jgi:hypothetical protein
MFTKVSRHGRISMVEAYSDVIRWSIREAQTSRLAPPVPSSGPAEHITRGPGITIPIALASLLSMHWHCCLCCTGVIALVALASAHWHCCLQHIVLAKLASLPVLLWCSCLHRAGVGTLVGWHCHPHRTGVLAFALAPPTELRWRLYPHAGITPLVALASA